MKKFLAILICTTLLFGISACKQTPATDAASAPSTDTTAADIQTTPVPPSTDEPSAIYEAPMVAVSLPIITESEIVDAKEIFRYTYQDVTVSLPDAEVAQAISLDLLNLIDKTSDSAAKIRESAIEDYSGQKNWYSYHYAILLEPMRLDQNVLSFYGTQTAFDGSPRPSSACISINYNLTTGEPLTLRGILHDDYSADVLCQLIVESLSGYSDSDLFFDYQQIIEDKFSTNVPVESWYFSENGLCFYFAPYEIAPGAAGAVVSEIPFDKLSGLLKDAFFPAEQLNYSGNVVLQPVDDEGAILKQYTQFAELIDSEQGKKYLLHTDGSVEHLRIQTITDEQQSITVFAAAGIGPTDAVVIQALPENLAGKTTVSFRAAGSTVIRTVTEGSDGTLSLN